MKKLLQKISGILALLFLTVQMVSAQKGAIVYNVKEFGAKGDGIALDSKAINKAIEVAAAAGGGTVYLPAGNYLSVTIHLKSNIALYIDQGATIIADSLAKDARFDLPEKNDNEIYQDYGHSHFHNSLIVGENLENISIMGPGRIWGRDLLRTSKKHVKDEDGNGNKTISLKLCRNIILKDFTVLHGGWFVLLLTGDDNMTIDNLKMDTNRDGMDVNSCQNVRISNCTVNSPQDDGICLKSDFALNYPRPCQNVTITNCQVSGYDEGSLLDGTYKRLAGKTPTGRIKFGTESNGGFKNITISNCVFEYCRGLALETVDGALLEDVTITNITMRDIVNSPIFVRLGARMRGPQGAAIGECRRIIISNIVAYNVDAAQAALIVGLPGHEIQDLKLSDIHIYFKGGGTREQSANVVPMQEKEYPEPGRFGITPSYGFFIRNVKDIKMNNIELHYLKDDLRPGVILDQVDGVDIQHIRVEKAVGAASTLVLKQVKNFNIFNSDGIANTKIADLTDKEF